MGEVEILTPPAAAAAAAAAARFCIGYALAPKKVNSIVRPSLLDHAKSRGIHLVPIDPATSLIEQHQRHPTPFHCIIHKLYDQQWKQHLSDFSAKFPTVPVIDLPVAIERLHDRVSMLQVVNDLEIAFPSSPPPPHQSGFTFGIPKQAVVYDSATLLIDHGLKFPVVEKPLFANGEAGSHEMHLVFDQKGLTGLNPPFVLQEFVSHGGLIFKVYVAGRHMRCVKRQSLPDISKEMLRSRTPGEVLPFSQISNLAANKDEGGESCWGSDVISQMLIEEVEMPPPALIQYMANALRECLKLNLFNFDMIRDVNDQNHYLVIDINYFPGYAKIPSYETMLTDFFLDVVHKEA